MTDQGRQELKARLIALGCFFLTVSEFPAHSSGRKVYVEGGKFKWRLSAAESRKEASGSDQ